MSNGGSDGTIFAFLTGAIIGVGVGILLAPKPGSETRKQLGDLAQLAQEKANDIRSRLNERPEMETETAHEGADGH